MGNPGNPFEDLLRGLGEDEESEDRTVYFRESPSGQKKDFEIVEKTRFTGAYPETVRELRTQLPLSCGHPVSKDNPFGGYCQARRGFLGQKRCGKELCSHCAVQCRCGTFIGPCCAREFEWQLFCRRCAMKLRLRKALRLSVLVLMRPFLDEGIQNDWKSWESTDSEHSGLFGRPSGIPDWRSPNPRCSELDCPAHRNRKDS